MSGHSTGRQKAGPLPLCAHCTDLPTALSLSVSMSGMVCAASMAQLPPASVRSHVPPHYPMLYSGGPLPSHYPAPTSLVRASSSGHSGLGLGMGIGGSSAASLPLPLSSPHQQHGEAWQSRFLEVSRPGQMSGELGLFTRELRKYTLVAVEPCVLWTIDTGALNAMQTQDPQCYIVLLRLALRYASHRLHSLMLVGQLHSV